MKALARPTLSRMILRVSSFLPCGGLIGRRGSKGRGSICRFRKESSNRECPCHRSAGGGVELDGLSAPAQPRHFQVAHVDDSRETPEPREEIEHRKIWTVRLDVERHLKIVRLSRDRLCSQL